MQWVINMTVCMFSAVNIECENRGYPLHQKQEIPNTARCLEIACLHSNTLLVFYTIVAAVGKR